MKCYKNSTYNTYIIFDCVVLTNTLLRYLRYLVETIFGEEISGSYTTSSCADDIFILARKVASDGLARLLIFQLSLTRLWYKARDIL